ncbi:Fanconi anemia group E protein isoform X2 [Lethenteron reissneri]|uniref:Fanconi anemia group E protein isoform X2 n=1 Tax=Lethenteron reissneri TaxID=7753 RepID=UPI002AB72C9D|nr:Fanconi anemia group E protein isoform X2 [Lethenteron reissneri]
MDLGSFLDHPLPARHHHHRRRLLLLRHALLVARRPEAAGLACVRRLEARGSPAAWGPLVAELVEEVCGEVPGAGPGQTARLALLPALLRLPVSLQRSVVSLLSAVRDEVPAPALALLRRALLHPAATCDPWVRVAARTMAPLSQRVDDGGGAVSEVWRARYAALCERLRARSRCQGGGGHRRDAANHVGTARQAERGETPVLVVPGRGSDDEGTVGVTCDPAPSGTRKRPVPDDDGGDDGGGGESGNATVAPKRPRLDSPRHADDLSASGRAVLGGDPGTPVPGPRESSDGGGGDGGGGVDILDELPFPKVEPEQGLPPHIKEKVAKVKEWLEASCEFPGMEESSPAELSLLNECRPEQVSAVCAALGAATLPEESVALLATAVAALTPKIGHAASTQLARELFLSKLSSLEQPASRLLSGALGSFCSSYPKQGCAACLLPLTQTSELGPFQVEFMCRVIRDNLASDDLPSLLRLLVSSPGVCWGEGFLTVLQAALDRKMELNAEEVEMLVVVMSAHAASFAKSLKFAKLLLALVNKHGAQVTRGHGATLAAMVEVGDTFMKRTLRAALKKISG